MRSLTKIVSVLLIASLFAVALPSRSQADDTLQVTLRDALYGGAIGALLGTAVLLVTDNPDDHYDYIPTGAGLGVLIGATYGVASSGVVQSLGEIDSNGHFALKMPTFRSKKIYDRNANATEVINVFDVLRLKF